MRRLLHLLRLLREVVVFSVTTRRWSLIVVLVVGLALTGLIVASQVLAPVAIYPFV